MSSREVSLWGVTPHVGWPVVWSGGWVLPLTLSLCSVGHKLQGLDFGARGEAFSVWGSECGALGSGLWRFWGLGYRVP